MSINPALMTEPLLQATLEWPGTDETCPKCRGPRHVYYLHAGQPGVEVFGGKRITCPVCAGKGTVRAPLQSKADQLAGPGEVIGRSRGR
jgi:hypothetical protein